MSTPTVHDTDTARLDAVLDALASSSAALADTPPRDRARALRAVADALDAERDELVVLAGDETALPSARLVGEVRRTSGQLRMFADGLDDGSVLDVVIDTADP
ncbi:MAG: aldehyde dehydrogenase family protein, partial [Actinomycetes bacterium]